MPRAKATKDKVAMAPQPVAPAVVQPHLIDPAHFVQVRDAFTTRMRMLQQTILGSIINDFTRSTNLLLGIADDGSFGGPSGSALMSFEASLDQLTSFPQPIPAALPGTMAAPPAVAPPAEEQKKERKKRSHDPNAPKRPLTPYFLYMQTARPIIANDLGAAAPKGAVQEEGQRRWATMAANEKAGWNNAYQYNLRLYNARVHSYKAGNVDAKNMDDSAAQAYADANGIPLPNAEDPAAAVNDQAAIAEQLGGADAHGEVDDAPAPKAKKAGGGRKRKTAGEDEIQAPATPASPAQKRRRSTKAADPEEPKKSGRKKAAKA